ncbi:MAG TPA: NADP-dependent phosphogluconate dehydrogenase, partial [Terriglobales bacterium]|nr:NADP-dependent phosphogluconate dehydrogenase [Terriglobales bacterium]
RITANKKLTGPNGKFSGSKQELVSAVHDALYAAKICSYTQGMSLIQAGSAEYKWGISLKEMARIWTGGCIIRARFLKDIMRAFEQQPDLPNLLLDHEFTARITKAEPAWRKLIGTAVNLGIPVPAMMASLGYYDSYRSASLPQNLTQAQRDLFGAHTYQRADDPNGKFIHTDWQGLIAKGKR